MLPHRFFLACLVAATVVASPGGSRGDDLACLKPGPGNDWYSHLLTRAPEPLDRRDERYERLKTPDEIRDYQRSLRETFLRQLGGFPEREPLHAEVTGRIDCDGYRIEKVVFESEPRHHVTANLYLPDGPGPFPGVLVASGHGIPGKADDYNQRYAISLARHGMAALAYDPLGQGERAQELSPEGVPLHPEPVIAHFRAGTGSILVGRNVATRMIWDSMRAIDYLETRPEIDASRIGMTGCSGGGNITSYVMALDERVICAAPSCYLTTLRRLLETIGPQDAEQNIFGQLTIGLDQTDYVLLHAPRPTLTSATTGDFFDIRGSWENFRQSKRIYARLGASERVDLVEAEGVHGVQPENLAAITQWMRRWLVGKDEPVPLKPFSEFRILPRSELDCTPRGQVMLLPGERSIYDINGEIAAKLAAERAANRRGSVEDLRADVRRLAGIALPDSQSEVRAETVGTVARQGYSIEKMVLRGPSPVGLPALSFARPGEAGRTYLYLHDAGKAVDAGVGGPIEKLVAAGHAVIAVDLRSQGETARGSKPDRLLNPIGDYKTFFLAYLFEQSLVGTHAEDILTAGRFAARGPEGRQREVHLVASGRVGVAALHAAALEPDLFKSLSLRGTPASWTTVAGSAEQATALTATVHGALSAYDLDDLVAALPAGSVTLEP
jgi:dienelactone hydrolase